MAPSDRAADSQLTSSPSQSEESTPSDHTEDAGRTGARSRPSPAGGSRCGASSRRCRGRGSSSACWPRRPRACRRPAWPRSATGTGRPRCGEEHRRERGDQQQLDDARLGQGDVVPRSSRECPRVRLPMTRCAAPERSRCPLVRCGRGESRSRTGCPWAYRVYRCGPGGLALDSMRLRSLHGDRLDPVVINAGAPAGRPRSERPGADPAPHKGVVKSRDRPDLHPGGADPFP